MVSGILLRKIKREQDGRICRIGGCQACMVISKINGRNDLTIRTIEEKRKVKMAIPPPKVGPGSNPIVEINPELRRAREDLKKSMVDLGESMRRSGEEIDLELDDVPKCLEGNDKKWKDERKARITKLFWVLIAGVVACGVVMAVRYWRIRSLPQ